MELKTIKVGGVAVISDMGLYEAGERCNTLVLLSIYGSPQQTKAVFSAIATSREARVLPDNMAIRRGEDGSVIRAKGSSIGYGKHHMLVWDEAIERMVVWLGPENKAEAFEDFIESRKIPCEWEYHATLERALINKKALLELKGWGGICGYAPRFTDDEACDLMIKILARPKRLRKAV